MFGCDRRKIARLMGLDYLGMGLIGQVLAAAVGINAWGDPNRWPQILAGGLLTLATGVLLGGCGIFLRYHRLTAWWGLLGFFSVAGVLILLTLPSLPRRKWGRGCDVVFDEPYQRDVWRMDVRVRLHENLQTAVREPVLLQLPRGANVGTAMKTLSDVIPGLHDGLHGGDRQDVQFRINGGNADRRSELSDGDELAVSATIGAVGA